MKRTIERITRTAMLAVAFMLCATTSAWAAAKPIAVWNGDFTVVSRGGVTVSLNGNSNSDGNLTITDSSSLGTTAGGGVYFEIPSAKRGKHLTTVIGANLSSVDFSDTRYLMTFTQGSAQNKVGACLNTSRKFVGIWNGGPWDADTKIGTSAWPTTDTTRYIGYIYNPTAPDTSNTGVYGQDGSRIFVDASSTADYNQSGLRDSANIVAGVTIGGYRGANSLDQHTKSLTNAKIKFIALFTAGDYATVDDVVYWSLTGMTKAAATFVGSDANTGVNIPASGETISAATTAAAVFVQDDARLTFTGSGALTIGGGTGPLYVADDKTLTLDLSGAKAPTIDTPVVKVVSGTLFGKSQVSVSAVPTAANGFIDYKIADDGVYLYYSPKTASFALGIDDGVNGTYVTTSTQTAFTGITLQEFYDGGYEIKGRLAGGSINNRGVVATGYNPVVTKDGSGNVTAIRYEMKAINNEVKCVVITLTPNDGNTGINVVATPVTVAGNSSAALYAASSWPIGNAFLSGDSTVAGVSKGTLGTSYSAVGSYCLYYLHIVGKFDKEIVLTQNTELSVGTDLATAYNSLTVSGAGRLSIAGGRCSTDRVSISSGATLVHSGATVLGGDISLGSGAKLAIAAGDGVSLNFGMPISGGGAVDVESGVVTINGNNASLTGGITVKTGAKLKPGAWNAFGPQSNDTWLTVESGGTVDMGGTGVPCSFRIAGDGEGNGAIVNTGAAIGNTTAQMRTIELTADASIGGTGNFGMIANNYTAVKLKFPVGGATLTKKGSNSFWLCNVSRDTSGGNGTIVVEEGSLYVRYQAQTLSGISLDFNGGTLTGDAGLTVDAIDIESGSPCKDFGQSLTATTVNVIGGSFARNNTTSVATLNVNNGGSATLNAYVKPTAATVAAGGAITAEKWGSGGIEFSTTLRGAGSLQFQGDNGCKISLTDVSGFTGSVINNANLGVRLGASTGDVDNGCILLNSSAEQTIDASKTWSAKTGIMVNSALSNSGTIDCPTLTVNGNGALTNNGTVNADTLDANGTVTATTQIGAEALNVGASSAVTGSYNGGGSGTLTLNGVVAGASFTGYSNLIINDGVTQATTLGFTPTLLTLNGSGSYLTAAGTEGSVLFGQNATGALTLTVDDETVNYNGYTPAVYGSGAVTYSCTGSEGSNITTSGYALLPYYSVWTPQTSAGETGDGAWWKNTTAPAENKNVAFGVAGGATITVNTTIAYGEAQVYGNGSGTFIKSGDNTISFTKLSIVSGATLTLTGTSGITASAIYVEEGSTLILDGYTPTCNITGGGTVKLAGAISLSTAISVDPTIEVEGTATLNASTAALTIKDTIAVKNGGNLTVSGTVTGTPDGGAISVVAGGTLNTSNLTATGGIVMAGSMASTGSLNVTELVVMGTANLTGATITSTKATGAGTVVFVGQKNIPDLKWSDAGWRGTVWFDTVTDQWENFCPTNYCNNSSTIKFSDVKLYFANQTLTAGILELSNSKFNGTTAEHALWVSDGFKTSTITFQALTGGGKFYSDTGAAPLIVFNTVSGFTGNIEIGDKVRLRIGTGNDSVDTGHIVITSGATETIPTGATWQTKYGIDVKGGLKFVGTGTAAVTDSSSSVATYSGSTLDFSEASAGSRISGALTLASGTTIKLPAGATLPYQLATSGDGGLIDNVTVQIGNESPRTGYVALPGGAITTLTSVNIDTDTTYSVAEVFGTPSATSAYEINVTSDATLTVPETTVGMVLYNFTATDNTVTLAGGYKIPATASYLKITDAASLTAGNYTLFQWTTKQVLSAGYGTMSSLDVSGLPGNLSAELVYCVDKIVLRVYDTAAQAAKGTLKIWAYGDSITEGFNLADTCANYRGLLCQKLSLLGFNVETVGCYDKISNAAESSELMPKDPAGQDLPPRWRWHSAKHGSTAGPTSADTRANLIENVDSLCAQVGKPDVVLLHIGVNDLGASQDFTGATMTKEIVFNSWTNVVWHLVNNLPESKIIVSTLLYGNASSASRKSSNAKIKEFNELVRTQMNLAPGAAGAFPSRVILADLNTCFETTETEAAPAGITIDTGIDYLHPDWWGCDQMAEGWLSAITDVSKANFSPDDAFPSATPLVAPTSEQLGAAAKAELATYLPGFRRVCYLEAAHGLLTNLSDAIPYVEKDDTIAANTYTKVGYFVEIVRSDNNAHQWVWVDMDAFGERNLEDVGLPVKNIQQVVTSLHVMSNHRGIETVAADDDSVSGFIEFSPYQLNPNASGVAGAPADENDTYDWNDTLLNNYGSFACMQVHRIAPSSGRAAQVLFAYNNWRSAIDYPAELGIGNLSQHFFKVSGKKKSTDWTATSLSSTLNTSKYNVKRIEIWAKPEYTATMSATGNFSGLEFSPTLPGDISACDLVVNVTDNATLTFDSAMSVGSMTFNIAENKTLTLADVSNLTAGKVIVYGTGTLKIAGSITTDIEVFDDATFAFGSGESLAITGNLIVASGKTLTIVPEGLSVASTTLLSAASIDGSVSVSLAGLPVTHDYTVEAEGTEIIVNRVVKSAKYYNAAVGKWNSSWAFSGGYTIDRLRPGPNDEFSTVIEVSNSFNPYTSTSGFQVPSDKAWSFSIYADVSKMSDSTSARPVIACFGNYNNSDALILYREGDSVKLRRHKNGNAVGGWAASVPAIAGFHLYTFTCDPKTGIVELYADTGDNVNYSSNSGTPEYLFGEMSLSAGFQLGAVFGTTPSGFATGTGMAVASFRYYEAALDAGEVSILADEYPAVCNSLYGQIDNLGSYNSKTDTGSTLGSSPTLTIYSGEYDENAEGYIGISSGTLLVPQNNTVSVPHIRVQNATSGSTTVNIRGVVNVTSESNDPNLAWVSSGIADYLNYKGVLLGNKNTSGTGAFNVYGTLDASRTYIQTVNNSTGAQTLTVDGGTLKVKCFYADRSNASTVTLQGGGTLEMSETTKRGQSIGYNFGYGVFKANANMEISSSRKMITNFCGEQNQPTTLDPNGYVLTMAGDALSGSGHIKIASGTTGTVVFNGGSFTGTVIIDANAATVQGTIPGTLKSGVADNCVCSVTANATTTYYPTFASAIEAAGENEITVYGYNNETLPDHYRVKDGKLELIPGTIFSVW